jgi:hypothetical protein
MQPPVVAFLFHSVFWIRSCTDELWHAVWMTAASATERWSVWTWLMPLLDDVETT